MSYNFSIIYKDGALYYEDLMDLDYHKTVYSNNSFNSFHINICDNNIDLTYYYKSYYDFYRKGLLIKPPIIKISDYDIDCSKISIIANYTNNVLYGNILYDRVLKQHILKMTSLIDISTICNVLNSTDNDYIINAIVSYKSLLNNYNSLSNNDILLISNSIISSINAKL